MLFVLSFSRTKSVYKYLWLRYIALLRFVAIHQEFLRFFMAFENEAMLLIRFTHKEDSDVARLWWTTSLCTAIDFYYEDGISKQVLFCSRKTVRPDELSPPADDGSPHEDNSQPENDGEGTHFWENLSTFKHNKKRRKQITS